MPGKATKKVRPVRAGKYDARELWKRSPSPAEDWGSDADVDFNLEIVGEEVGYDGEIKYEIEWRNWTRADGTSTTWEGADTTSTHLPTADWEEKRLAELPDRPDVVLWGTTDIANTRTRERKQGYDGTVSEEERAAFQEDFDGMVSRMDELMEENKEQFPEMYARYTREKQGAGARAETPPTAAPTMPLPRQHYAQVNAQAGPSRPRVNAEAGPSRTSSTPSTSRPSPIQPTASSSRVPAPTSRPPPAQQTASSSSSRPPPPRSPLPRRSSVISISSSADSIQFINMTGPPPIRTKRPATPTPPVGTPAAKRRALPLPPDLVSGAASMSNTTRPSASATPIASSSRPSTSRPPVASSSRTGSNASAASTSATLVASSSRPSTSKPPAAPSSRTSTTFVSACGSGSRLPPLAAFFRGRPSPPAPLPYTLPSHTESAAFWDASTASAAAIRSTRPAADVLPRSSTHPHRDSTPPSTALTRTRQSRSPAQPARRALKRKHPDSDGRTCGCGTLLPPPDVHRGELCDGCRNTATNKRWAMKQTSAPPLPRTCACGTLLPPPDVHRGETCDGCRQSEARARAKGKGKGTQPAALGRGVGVNTMQSGSTHSARALEVVASKTPVRQPLPLPLPGSSSMRKGKARENVKSLRLQTETTWSTIAEKAGAAGLTFVNDVDDEEVPPTLRGFVYLEDEYHLAPALDIKIDPACATPLMTPLFFTYCDCGGDKKGDKEGECGSLECGCQDAAEALGSAYTNGLFNFTYGPDQVVVECNPYCHCSPNCPNRVAQSGRQVPIEIFKTARCGWGVRAPVDVERGTVLGMYTGSLIPRAEAMDLTGEAKEYCFDLDYNQEHEDEEDLTEKYTVDSLRYGNWTRFINHSCEPNLRVQPIVYDTLPSQNMAYLTFIAMERIPARTELTFDYDPAVQRDHKVTQGQQRKGWKRKSESERPESATDCVCGADPERCRGWVRTK